jgi:hypothetical protein
MTKKNYDKSSAAIVGSICEAMESYDLPEAQINTIKKILWSELDKNFGRHISE